MRFLSIKNNKGFTMIEAMISLAIISLGLLVITRTQIASINGNRTASNNMKASLETNATMELLMSMPFYTAPQLSVAGTPITSVLPTIPSGFTTTYTVTNIPVGTEDTIRSLTLRIAWTDGNAPNGANARFFDSQFLLLPNSRRP